MYQISVQNSVVEPTKNYEKVLAIDPGLKNSCGWCVTSRTGSEITLHEFGTFDMKKLTLDSICSEFKNILTKHDTTSIFIERFRFYTGFASPEKPSFAAAANGATVVRMTEFIFFLYGWFSANGYICKLDTSNIWKRKLDKEGKHVVEKKLRKLISELTKCPVSKLDAHWIDAFGMSLVYLETTFNDDTSPKLVFRVSTPIKQPCKTRKSSTKKEVKKTREK